MVVPVVLLTAAFVFFAFSTPALAAAATDDDDDEDDRPALVVGVGSIGEGSEVSSESKFNGRTKDVNWGWLRMTVMGRRNNGMCEFGLSAS